MEIEELDPGRAPDAVDLWSECGLTRPWNDPAADLARAVTGTASTVLGALSGETLVGTVMVGHDGHRGWVYYLAVAPDRQRQGIGRLLMGAAEDWLKRRDVPKIHLMVRATNAGVVAFYARLGYVDQDCLVLGRRLDGVDDGRR